MLSSSFDIFSSFSLILRETHTLRQTDKPTTYFSASGMSSFIHGIFMRGEDHFVVTNEKEGEFSLISETIAAEQSSIIMEVHHHQHHQNTEFSPVEHPMEPPDEDRPVKCPMPGSSVISDGRIQEKRFGESLRKRGEISGAMAEGERMDTQPPARGVRKRHHTLTNGGDIVMTPFMRMPPLPPVSSQNITIFQVLQQLDKFES